MNRSRSGHVLHYNNAPQIHRTEDSIDTKTAVSIHRSPGTTAQKQKPSGNENSLVGC